MSFTVNTWQQALATGAFFFVGAFCWHLGQWCLGQITNRLK